MTFHSKILISISASVLLLISCTHKTDDTIIYNKSYDSCIDSLIELWNGYNRTGNFDSLIHSAAPYIRNSILKGDSFTALYAGVFTAQSHLFLNNNDSVKYYADLIAPLESKSNYYPIKVIFNNVMGSWYLQSQLDYSKALEYYLQALQWAEKTESKENRIILLANIVNIFYMRDDIQGMEYALTAYAYGHNAEETYIRCISALPLAQMSCLAGDISNAEKYINDVLELAETENITSLYTIINTVAAEVEFLSGRHDTAMEYYQKALQYTAYTDPGTVSLLHLKYGSFLEAVGEKEKAMGIYTEGLALSGRLTSIEFQNELLSHAAKLAENMGHNTQALTYALKYISMSDTLLSNQEQDFYRLIISDNKAKHEKEVLSKELEKQKIQQSLAITAAITATTVMLLLFLLLQYRRQRKLYRTLVAQHSRYMEKMERQTKQERPREPYQTCKQDEMERELFSQAENLMMNDKVYRRKDICRDKLAEMLKTNRTYLSSTVNHFAGMSINQWINMYRIAEAIKILSNPNDTTPLKQIADDLGYNSLQVFHKAFQRSTGQTPGSYRKKPDQENPDPA